MSRFSGLATGALCVAAVLALPLPSHAQLYPTDDDAAAARRAAGLRVGVWNVRAAAADSLVSTTPLVEAFFQRGLDEHIALESTISIWRSSRTERQVATGRDVETRTWIIPLFTSLKLYPVTTVENVLEPYFSAGVGFALGLVDVGDNAIGGGGTSIVTGFGFRGNAGFDVHVTGSFGLLAAARYQWIRFGTALDGGDTYEGVGFEGGITYRAPL